MEYYGAGTFHRTRDPLAAWRRWIRYARETGRMTSREEAEVGRRWHEARDEWISDRSNREVVWTRPGRGRMKTGEVRIATRGRSWCWLPLVTRREEVRLAKLVKLLVKWITACL